jgi:hypothetical protein
MMHFLIERYCYKLFVSIQCASMTTRYPPPSNYVTNNPHVEKVASGLLYRPQHAPRDPVILVWTRWWKCYWMLVKPCKNHRYGGSLEVPGLRLVRNILRRRMRGIQSGLRRRRRRPGRQWLSSDKLLAGVDAYEGAVESAVRVLGEEVVEEDGELSGEIIVWKALLLLDLEGAFAYDDWVTNLGCECERRSEPEEK